MSSQRDKIAANILHDKLFAHKYKSAIRTIPVSRYTVESECFQLYTIIRVLIYYANLAKIIDAVE